MRSTAHLHSSCSPHTPSPPHMPLPCTHPCHAHTPTMHTPAMHTPAMHTPAMHAPMHAWPHHACMPPPCMHAPTMHACPHACAPPATHTYPMHAYPCHTCKPLATYPHPVDRMRHPCENSTFRFEGGKQNQHKRECLFKFIYWSTFMCVCTLLLWKRVCLEASMVPSKEITRPNPIETKANYDSKSTHKFSCSSETARIVF